MEAGGFITEVGWTEFDFLSHGEESEVMEQLLGAFPSHGEEGHHELLHWPDQASDAYSDSIPPACEGYYFLSNSNEALGSSSCTAPADALGSVQEEHGAAEYLNVTANHSFNCYGNGDPSCEDLDDPVSVSMLSSVSAAANKKSKRKHTVEELDGQTQTRGRKCARSVGEAKRAKKAKKSGDEDSSMAVPNGSPTSCCTSDSDSNASLESADADADAHADADADADARRPKGKGRAGRGVTTEPQSIYARKRRERINGRLKILQNLVPNGTKVDISTMLEEAVHYVKFLQLQIRLLSSDDTWMYAPIAYNGMNIGIDLNMMDR